MFPRSSGPPLHDGWLLVCQGCHDAGPRDTNPGQGLGLRQVDLRHVGPAGLGHVDGDLPADAAPRRLPRQLDGPVRRVGQALHRRRPPRELRERELVDVPDARRRRLRPRLGRLVDGGRRDQGLRLGPRRLLEVRRLHGEQRGPPDAGPRRLRRRLRRGGGALLRDVLHGTELVDDLLQRPRPRAHGARGPRDHGQRLVPARRARRPPGPRRAARAPRGPRGVRGPPVRGPADGRRQRHARRDLHAQVLRVARRRPRQGLLDDGHAGPRGRVDGRRLRGRLPRQGQRGDALRLRQRDPGRLHAPRVGGLPERAPRQVHRLVDAGLRPPRG